MCLAAVCDVLDLLHDVITDYRIGRVQAVAESSFLGRGAVAVPEPAMPRMPNHRRAVNLSVAEVAKLVPELYREVEDAQYLEDALLQLVQVACAPLQKSAFMLLFTHFMSKSQLVVHINKNVSLLDEPGAVQVLHTLTLGLSLPLTLTLTLTLRGEVDGSPSVCRGRSKRINQ